MASWKWFAACATREDVKKRYRDLVKEHHPDIIPNEPGNEEVIRRKTLIMQEINIEYARASQSFAESEHAEAKANGRKTQHADPADAAAVDEAIRGAIEKIIIFDFLNIEICGLWVWVDGTQKRGASPVNDAALEALMNAGYHFAGQKKAWYYAGVPGGGRGKWTRDRIRERYGSQRVDPIKRARLGGDDD